MAAASLTMTEKYEKDIVNIRITANDSQSLPAYLLQSLPGYPMPERRLCASGDSDLHVQVDKDPCQLTVMRRADGSRYQQPLFSTKPRFPHDAIDSFLYKHLYVEIGTQLPSTTFIYGLGERVGEFRKGPGRYAFNARDTSALEGQNTYGSHPFYLDLRPDGQAHGVLMLSASPMEVQITTDALIFRIIGGMIDLYILAGPTPDLVIEQYTRIVGRPPLPNPRMLGLHQSRFGYDSLDKWKSVIRGYEENNLPLDGIWFDIEYGHKISEASVSNTIQSVVT
jgi:alpha-glucosidase (family GH31 glycosyl hydrolase)